MLVAVALIGAVAQIFRLRENALGRNMRRPNRGRKGRAVSRFASASMRMVPSCAMCHWAEIVRIRWMNRAEIESFAEITAPPFSGAVFHTVYAHGGTVVARPFPFMADIAVIIRRSTPDVPFHGLIQKGYVVYRNRRKYSLLLIKHVAEGFPLHDDGGSAVSG